MLRGDELKRVERVSLDIKTYLANHGPTKPSDLRLAICGPQSRVVSDADYQSAIGLGLNAGWLVIPNDMRVYVRESHVPSIQGRADRMERYAREDYNGYRARVSGPPPWTALKASTCPYDIGMREHAYRQGLKRVGDEEDGA